jgi:hypothetical protein
MSTRRSKHGSRSLLAGLLLLGLVACQTRPPQPAPQPVPAPAPEITVAPAGSREYHVVAGESLLQIFVYRGGAMARLGHNHVIASHDLAGAVYVTDDPLGTRFDIRFPVAALTVDEPALRQAAGADFPAAVPQNAREGTRNNMLSEALLDGARYPQIRLRATDLRAAAEGYDVGIEVTLKGATHALRVPVAVRREADAITASGEFPLKQSELDLQPFSTALGALVVLDGMRVKFELTARR